MPQTCGNVVLHIIFSTKERLPLITQEIRADLFAYPGGIIGEMRGTALIINGDGGSRTRSGSDSSGPFAGGDCADHQDEFVEVGSSGEGAKFSWQAGYGVFSVSESSVASVIKYIAEQESHHRKRSFQQEFLAFLKKNKVPYDPRYIWD